MPCTSSCSAAVTISSTERLWPRWITSAPEAWRIRRMMLIEASWPSNRLAAVTKRSLKRARAAPDRLFDAQIGHRCSHDERIALVRSLNSRGCD